MDSAGERHTDSVDIIPLAQIASGDETFRITTRKDFDDLQASIYRLGLLTLPLLIGRPAGAVIVSGFRRIAACNRLGWKRIRARVLCSEKDAYECARRAVGENSTQRTLNLIETSRALGLLERQAPGRAVPAADLTALGLPCHPDLVDRIKRLAQLPSVVQEGILEGSIAFVTACELGQLEEGLASRFAGLFRRLRISLNKQREILWLALEIAQREDVSGGHVLEAPELARALGERNLDRGQKAQRLLQLLRHRRYPARAATEANFKRLRQRLKLGGNLRLTPPRDFEGTVFNFSLAFENLEDLRHLRERLDALIQHPDLKTILDAKGSRFEAHGQLKSEGGNAGK